MRWTEIKRITNVDGDRRLRVFAEPGGLFCFEEEVYATEDGVAFWSYARFSWLYDSALQRKYPGRALRIQISPVVRY
jgi:hypothetical protein